MKLDAPVVSPLFLPPVARPRPVPEFTSASAIDASDVFSSNSSDKIRQSTRQFEAQLLTSLLASLEKSFGSVPGSEESGASAQYRSLATQSLASAWADAGGVGIARILTGVLLKAAHNAASQFPAPPTEAPKTGVPPAAVPADLWRPLQALPRWADIGTGQEGYRE